MKKRKSPNVVLVILIFMVVIGLVITPLLGLL